MRRGTIPFSFILPYGAEAFLLINAQIHIYNESLFPIDYSFVFRFRYIITGLYIMKQSFSAFFCVSQFKEVPSMFCAFFEGEILNFIVMYVKSLIADMIRPDPYYTLARAFSIVSAAFKYFSLNSSKLFVLSSPKKVAFASVPEARPRQAPILRVWLRCIGSCSLPRGYRKNPDTLRFCFRG